MPILNGMTLLIALAVSLFLALLTLAVVVALLRRQRRHVQHLLLELANQQLHNTKRLTDVLAAHGNKLGQLETRTKMLAEVTVPALARDMATTHQQMQDLLFDIEDSQAPAAKKPHTLN